MAVKSGAETCRKGRVVERKGERVLVEIDLSSCAGCSMGAACGMASQKATDRVWARDRLGVKKGDQVQLAVSPRSEVEIACILYLLPVICLVLGAVLGQFAGAKIGLPSRWWAPLSGLFCASVSLLFGRWYAAKKGDVIETVAVNGEERR